MELEAIGRHVLRSEELHNNTKTDVLIGPAKQEASFGLEGLVSLWPLLKDFITGWGVGWGGVD